MANEKEITIKAIKKADDRVSIMDLGGDWYSGWKNSCTDDTWAILNKMEAGQHADIQFEISKKGFKNLTGFIPVRRPESEANRNAPPDTPAGMTIHPSAASEKDDRITKLALCHDGAAIVAALIKGAGEQSEILVDPAGKVLVFAKRLYQGLQEDWK